MHRSTALLAFLLLFCIVVPRSFAQEPPRPETIVEKMAFKLTRGVTNIATSVVELPKQSYLTVRDEGKIGYVIGPLKGIGMTVYRAFIGCVETVAFLVPQPGYYDPMIDPEYVWKGWEKRGHDNARVEETGASESQAEKNGE